MNIKQIFAVSLLAFPLFSFTPRENPSINFVVKGNLDSNGYIHMDLDWTGYYYPRFTVGVDATTSKNERVVAKFTSDAGFDVGMYGEQEVVQSTTLYLSKYAEGKSYTKRTIGPIPPQMEGDTLLVNVEIVRFEGKSEKKSNYLLKFIVE